VTAVKEPRWITKHGLLLLHDRSLALHGGAEGMRDEGLLDSALVRPQNRFHYEGMTDLSTLAATYAGGIAANHPFIDGNKRAAFLAAGLFLEKNGLRLNAEPTDAALTILALAAGKLGIDALSEWVRSRTGD
jgi:death-on-curing protein